MKIRTIAVSALLMFVSATGYAGNSLSGDEIKEAWAGKTMVWKHMTKSRSGKSYFAADGSLIGVTNGKKREGKWHIDGNKVCVSWSKCTTVQSDGNGGFYKVIKGSKKVVHITAVEEGNTI
ncbi:MAG: hypothetical protein ABW066_16640 [Sedimenticola sp.]